MINVSGGIINAPCVDAGKEINTASLAFKPSHFRRFISHAFKNFSDGRDQYNRNFTTVVVFVTGFHWFIAN